MIMAKTLFSSDYKNWGHQMIDRLVELGVPRNQVYSRLSKKMHHPVHKGHFGRTDNPDDLMKMVRILQTMVEKQEKNHTEFLFRKKEKNKAINLRHKEEKQFKKLPWYKKLYLQLFS